MQPDSQIHNSVDSIERRRKYMHAKHGVVEVHGFDRIIRSIDSDGTIDERITVQFDINATDEPVYTGEEEQIVSEEYRQSIQSVERELE